MRPADLREKYEDQLWAKVYANNLHRPTKPSQFGKIARISKIMGLFKKFYVPNLSEEHFHIISRIRTMKPVVKLAVHLRDDRNGQFYDEELQPIEENRYLTERIIRKRKTSHGTQEFLVKWKRWPTKFNSRMKEEDCYYYIQKSKEDESK